MPLSLTTSHNKIIAGNLVLQLNLRSSVAARDLQTHNNFAIATHCRHVNRELGLVIHHHF
jgi:hypothetical protein